MIINVLIVYQVLSLVLVEILSVTHHKTRILSHNLLYINSYKPNIAQNIYGLSTGIPEGGCGIAIVRISGPNSLNILKLLTKNNDSNDNVTWEPRRAKLCKITSLIDNHPIDDAITIYFPSPRTFTGEDVVEIHTHGSKSIVSELFDNFRFIANHKDIELRQAEPGEFTRRAFYNGKINLTQAEGLRDLIASDTPLKRKDSYRKYSGDLSCLYLKWIETITRILARIEARIDFDEEIANDINLPKNETENIRNELNILAQDIDNHLNDERAEIIMNGLNLLLIGPPNAGKSSFINTICSRDVSIVSDVPGTTRDVIQTCYKYKDLHFQIIDTAGLRSVNTKSDIVGTSDTIEMIGINKALNKLNEADVILFLFDPFRINESNEALKMLNENLTTNPDIITCITKEDLVGHKQLDLIINELKNNKYTKNITSILKVCNLKRTSVDEVMDVVYSIIHNKYFDHSTNNSFITDQRHKSHLNNIITSINATIDVLNKNNLEIIAEYMRDSIEQFEFIIGERTNEDLLDLLFKTFCIGK